MPPQTTTLPSGKLTYTTPSTFEAKLGYHRAIRKGPFIFVSGTTALRPSPSSPTETYALAGPGDAHAQTHAAFTESLVAVEALGGTKADVVRVRMYVARQEDTEKVGRAFAEIFGTGRMVGEKEEESVAVAATMVVLGAEGGGGFVDPEMLVEVEIDAVVG
jgi:enamine deaminase RidA (YjgF/YER057c/UK114 family)